ncbi:transketolase C-terminal domain-containing protein, partial [Thermodesulfobacteriota bacterium]
MPGREDETVTVRPLGRNFHFGVREHVMGAVANGLALSGLRPYAGTFFVFSDYMRPAIRMSCLMGLPVIYVFTHDSIGVGEDGPTHQPVEHLASLRAIPNLDVIRPADANETAAAWRHAMGLADRPAALILSRQTLPTIDRAQYGPAEGALRGGYVLADPEGATEVILIGTGSEVRICLEAASRLSGEGIKARVVSMPCWSLFDRQDTAYREEVLPPDIRARVAIEAGVTFGWERYTGGPDRGAAVGLDRFGSSAPAGDLMKEYGITVEHVLEKARKAVAADRS